MNFLEPYVRQFAHRIGWNIGDKIENAVWTVVIAAILLCCCAFSCLAVVFQIVIRQAF
ncbi:MAG: hypothetical protein HYZ25_03575 [Chloroflexi bacterium]|nr:hypothetical protein [Chloroflexota bacterium]